MAITMTEQQERVWCSMLQQIDNYRRAGIGLAKLVRNLEGLLDAGEFRDAALVEAWYEYWTPLEIRHALHGEDVNKEEVVPELEAMAKFLHSIGPDRE